MTDTGKRILHISLMALLAAIFELLLVFSLLELKSEWSTALYLTALILGSVLNAAVFAIDTAFYLMGKEIVDRACITIYAFLIIAGIVLYFLLHTGFFRIIQDEGSFAAFLERSGKWMVALFILLQFLQVIILPIPSTVTVLAGTALFGPLMGSIYSLIGIVVGSLVAFMVGRYAGHRVVEWLIGKDTLDKWLKKIKGKDKLLLSAMFLLPVFPDDVLCFVAGISSMSIWLFLGIILVSRILAVFTTSYSIALIPFNTWWGILIWAILFLLVIVLFYFLYKKSDDILNWISKKFHRETRITERTQKNEFTLQVVSPDGAIIEKGVKKNEDRNNTEK